MESYILTQSMHLGHLKETFGRGAVIEFDQDTNKLVIGGRRFEDYRDIGILKRQAAKHPDKPWIVQYSEEALQDIRGGSEEAAPAVPKRAPNGDGMKIVQSDEDQHETIDIRHTQVSKRNQETQEAERNKTKSGDLPVIKGDETAEERIASLKDAKDTDIGARAERVRLMGSGRADMPIVHDDSLGAMGGSVAASMNARQPVSGRRAEETPDSVREAASSRKSEVSVNRQRVADETGLDPDQAGIDEVTPMPQSPAPAPAAEPAPEPTKADRIAALKAQLSELEDDAPEDAPVVPKKAKTPVVTTEG